MKPKRKRKRIPLIVWIAAPLLLAWLAFFHKDDYGMSSWEHFQDAFTERDWIGWIHPFGLEGNRVAKIGPFDSIEQCQVSAFDHMDRSYQGWEKVSYYCGYLCSSEEHVDREENCKVVRK
ncbi:MAG: hypothetical protein R3330_12605 [Saprospiraceae bacterium]|nr:hypothetical protein [Saprospiraceae bacterium]